jgi:hypothetical protein
MSSGVSIWLPFVLFNARRNIAIALDAHQRLICENIQRYCVSGMTDRRNMNTTKCISIYKQYP